MERARWNFRFSFLESRQSKCIKQISQEVMNLINVAIKSIADLSEFNWKPKMEFKRSILYKLAWNWVYSCTYYELFFLLFHFIYFSNNFHVLPSFSAEFQERAIGYRIFACISIQRTCFTLLYFTLFTNLFESIKYSESFPFLLRLNFWFCWWNASTGKDPSNEEV